MTCETRTVLARIDPDLMPLADFREESTRLAYFDQSRRTVAGNRAEYRPDEYTQEPRKTL